MYLLGLDLGTSSVKASVIDAQSQKILASASYPETEAEIISAHPGWASKTLIIGGTLCNRRFQNVMPMVNTTQRILQLLALPIKCTVW